MEEIRNRGDKTNGGGRQDRWKGGGDRRDGSIDGRLSKGDKTGEGPGMKEGTGSMEEIRDRQVGRYGGGQDRWNGWRRQKSPG